MDWNYITHHLISGYIPAAAGLALYFSVLHLFVKKQALGHIIASFVFGFYIVGILTVTGICITGHFSPRVSYIPFIDMVRGPVDTVLNILLFIPMGFFIPLLYEKYNKIGKVAPAGFLISLSIEITQMFGFGATDINDLITNTVGTCLGYGIYKMFSWVIIQSRLKKIQVQGNQCYYELPLFWLGALLIMLTVQVHIFHALFTS